MLQWLEKKETKEIIWNNIFICDASVAYTIHSYNSIGRGWWHRWLRICVHAYVCVCVCLYYWENNLVILHLCILWSRLVLTWNMNTYRLRGFFFCCCLIIYSSFFSGFHREIKYYVRQKSKKLTLKFLPTRTNDLFWFTYSRDNFFIQSIHQTLQNIFSPFQIYITAFFQSENNRRFCIKKTSERKRAEKRNE